MVRGSPEKWIMCNIFSEKKYNILLYKASLEIKIYFDNNLAYKASKENIWLLFFFINSCWSKGVK